MTFVEGRTQSRGSGRTGVAARGGFTFVELMMGIVITSMVMAALSAVCLAVATGWREGDLSRGVWLAGHGATTQLHRALRDAKYLGHVVPGDLASDPAVEASVVYWRADDFGPDDADGRADGVIQLGEMGLIAFDPAAGSIVRYETIRYDDMTPAQRAVAAAVIPRATLTDPLAADDFRAYVDPANGDVGLITPIARHVDAAAFGTVRADEATPTGRPVLTYELRFRRGGDDDATVAGGGGAARTSTERGAVTLRAASERPD